jgi:hypothetical protein
MTTCTHGRQWEYDPVAHRIRCAECGHLVTCDRATMKFNATRKVGLDLIAAAWNEVDQLRTENIKLRAQLATEILNNENREPRK